MITYPKIKRIPIPEQRIRGKRYLTEGEVRRLLESEVIIEEKLDGKTYPADMGNFRIFYEYMKWRHTVAYSALPSWRIAFDVWNDEYQRFLDYEEKSKFLQEHGYSQAPLIYSGFIDDRGDLLKFLGRPSAFGAEKIEGIVVKNYEEQLFGKVVDPDFENRVDSSEHWTKRKREMNKLKI